MYLNKRILPSAVAVTRRAAATTVGCSIATVHVQQQRLYTDGNQNQGGYRFFEDHFPENEPPQSYESYEEQMSSAAVTDETPEKEMSESEKLHQLHDWTRHENGTFETPPNFGWHDEWGPEPGEKGHNDWYKKSREYMSTDEKFKYDNGIQTPVKPYGLRHQKLPLHKRMEAAYDRLQKQNPKVQSTKTAGKDADYTPEEKNDYMMTARNEYMEEWLDKPGVEPCNLSLKIAEHHGTAKGKTVKPCPRRPEWELAPHGGEYD